jgi:hypothetical protein
VIATALALSTFLAAAPLRQDYDAPYEDDAGEGAGRLRLAVWGGDALANGGTGHGSTIWGGEAAWAFESVDLGVAGYGYESLANARHTWTPVVLARITERVRTRRDVDWTLSLGIGAGRPRDWTAWFQLALGVRVNLGPMFLAGELAFEQYDLLRLAAGVGVAF